MNLKEFEKLKAEVEQLQRDADRAAGALQQSKLRLCAEFDCANIAQARKLLEELEAEQAAAEKNYKKKYGEFYAKHSERLD